ncbi:MAG: hypothetical protein QXV37_03045 [Candidatus Jordarchaeaceae archaeon]
MNELQLTEYKMFEKAPYEQIDANIFTKIIVHGMQEESKIYGPVFTTRLIKYALEFLAQKIGENPPEDIKTLDQLSEYVLSKLDKYPYPYCAISYGQVKAENELQGQTGAGTRYEISHVVKNIKEKAESQKENLDASTLSLRQQAIKKIGDETYIDIDFILSEIRKSGVSLKIISPEMGYKKNEDGSVNILWPKCYFFDACQRTLAEGLLKRPDGRQRCAIGEYFSQRFKTFTGYEWDYECIEACKPHCITKLYLL